MTWKYFMPSLGETIEDAELIMRTRYDLATHACVEEPAVCMDHEDAAEAAAQQYRDQHDTEWCTGERTIAVVDKDGRIETFEVTIEYEPTFTARKAE